MQLNIKLMTNFTQQLKFISIILGIAVTILGSFDLNVAQLVYFIINCTCLGISALLFLGTVCDILKESEILTKFEKLFHTAGGFLLIIGSIITLSFGINPRYYSYANALTSALLGLLINGPLYLFIGWQLYGSDNRNPETLRPIYFSVSLTHNPVKFTEEIMSAPPKYSETYQYQSTSGRNVPPEYPQSTNVDIHQRTSHALL